MSRGTVALIGGLFVLSVVFILVVSLVVLISGTLREAAETRGIDFAELVWRSLLRTLDPGTMGGDSGSVPFVLAMLVITLGGIFIVATLIGVISNGIQGRLDDLRKGHSQVLESDHTVILGWSAQIFEIVAEIVEANANKHRQAIAILAERDKVEMEDEIRARVPDTQTTRVICRSGSPIELADLALMSLDGARAVIILPPEREDSDTDVVKTLLALGSSSLQPAGEARYSLVAQLSDRRNLDVARLASDGRAQLVLTGDLIGRIAAQTCRQPGLSIVYMDLLDFAGDEIYFWHEPELAGMAFGDALLEFRRSALIGIAPANGKPIVNPPMDRVIDATDELIFIARDDDTIVREARPADSLRESAIRFREHAPVRFDSTLVLGWNSRTAGLLLELDRYVAEGARLTVIGDGPGVADGVAAVGGGLQRMRLEYRAADTTDRDVLDAATADDPDHVVVMAYSDFLEPQRADARTLVTLLHLRDIEQRRGDTYTIVSEMLDVRNRALAAVTRADDFIVSNRLVSLAMAQLAENPRLRPVLDELFDEHGSEIYLKPAADYADLSAPLDFYTLTESARRRGEIAIGYRLMAAAEDAEANYGVVLNPDKAAAVQFSERDLIIVIAEN